MARYLECTLALVNACLEIEQDLRERGWDAVERVTALAAGRKGTLTERIKSLPNARPSRRSATCTRRAGSTTRPRAGVLLPGDPACEALTERDRHGLDQLARKLEKPDTGATKAGKKRLQPLTALLRVDPRT